jgi:low affinity Fe/Cu permease
MDENADAHEAQTDRLTNAAMGLFGRVWLIVLLIVGGFVWSGLMALFRWIF